MKPHKLSARKRLTKPVLFGSLVVGLAAAFFNRHLFMSDVEEFRAQERERSEAQRLEVLAQRRLLQEELREEKKRSSGGGGGGGGGGATTQP